MDSLPNKLIEKILDDLRGPDILNIAKTFPHLEIVCTRYCERHFGVSLRLLRVMCNNPYARVVTCYRYCEWSDVRMYEDLL